MKWFQHSVDSHDDPDISDAEDHFGDAGYTVFFKILEIYGREFNNLDAEGNLNISQTFIRRKLRKSWTKVEQILNFYQERDRIFLTINGQNISIQIPQFIEIASNWTKRPKKGKKPDLCSPSVAPTAKEVEAEAEIESKALSLSKDKPAKAGHFESTIQDKEILIQLLELAEAVRKQLPKFNPYQFIQKHKTTHPEALLKAFISLNALVSIKGETPKSGAYPYLTKIIKVEGPNYTEREAIAKHKALTEEMRKWVKEMK